MKTPNTFFEVLNTDLSDLVLKNTMVRFGVNMRIIDLDSSTYAITNIRGTEQAFTLTAGYVPIGAREFDNVLYLVSIDPITSIVELGSFGSPDYSGGAGSQEVYRPLNNLDDDPFRTTVFGYSENSFVKVVIQPAYDGSVNLLLFEKDNLPRLVNTKIRRSSLDNTLEVAPDRPSKASTNDYTASTVAEESKLIITSSQILKIALGSIESGGKLKYGTFRYYFAYMTEDFNITEIVGQSSLCTIYSGQDTSTLRGGNSSQETDKRVLLSLTNIDETFKYLKVYALYSSGVEGLEQQMLEFTNPTEITDSSMTFYHTGFEEIQEIDQDAVNISFQSIDAATTADQINGFLIAGGIRESIVDFTSFKNAAANVQLDQGTSTMAFTGSLSIIEGHAKASNVYDALGYFSAETYALRMVFVLPGGKLTPPFLVRGKDYNDGGATNDSGLIRFQSLNDLGFYTGTDVLIKNIVVDLSSVPAPVKAASIGFFFVRAERRPNLLSQGYLFPTLRVPPIEFLDSASTYYNRFQAGNESLYKVIPCVDNILEAYEQDTSSGGGDLYVVDINNTNKLNYYMPLFVNHFGVSSAVLSGYVNSYPTDHYAYISADELANEPALITSIAQRSGMKCYQIGKVQFNVPSSGTLLPIPSVEAAASFSIRTGTFYDFKGFGFYGSPTIQTIDLCEFVPAESFATGSVFSSKVSTRFKVSASSSGTAYGVNLSFNSYFGLKITSLTDEGYSAINPRGGNSRQAHLISGMETSGMSYSNEGTDVNAAFLVNIYPAGGLLDIEDLYPDVDSLVYKQVGKRYEWGDVVSDQVTLHDGDCFITKSYRKLYQSGKRDPFSPISITNINAGLTVALLHETPYNTHLRSPNRFDASEPMDRSFYPFQSKGDVLEWHKYRFPETLQYSQGFSPGLGPKSFIPVSSLAPFIRTDFFSRLSHSARNIPNAFFNGYRLFTGDNFRDYDPSMGRIMGLEAFRNQLTVIFEHGVAVADIEARVLTGGDTSGPVYAQPSSILPPNLEYRSRRIGSQHSKAVLQTPSAVYGIDADKKKIWQLRDTLKVISDSQVASFLFQRPVTNPRIGYDFQYNEVIFTTDNWTLCFREGLEKFTFPYSFKPTFYASRGNSFFSFKVISSTPYFHAHNADTRLIYGEQEDCFIEFTVNPSTEALQSVFDVLEIFSNEVAPSKIELFTYPLDSRRTETLDPSACGQYSHIEDITDFFKQESPINFRDKRFVVQIPNAENYVSALDNWRVGGRMRNKYLVVRLTYNTTDTLQLLSVLTTFRPSKS